MPEFKVTRNSRPFSPKYAEAHKEDKDDSKSVYIVKGANISSAQANFTGETGKYPVYYHFQEIMEDISTRELKNLHSKKDNIKKAYKINERLDRWEDHLKKVERYRTVDGPTLKDFERSGFFSKGDYDEIQRAVQVLLYDKTREVKEKLEKEFQQIQIKL